MKILVAHLDNIIVCPPAINVVEILLDHGHDVTLITYNAIELPPKVVNNSRLKIIDLGKRINPKNQFQKYALRLNKRRFIRSYFKDNYDKFDLIWTTSEIGVREIGDVLLKAKFVMQLMELVNYVPLFGNQTVFTFNIEKYAQAAYKVVVPEYNRAHIIKARWHLNTLPTILPNKPYDTRIDTISEEAQKIINIVKNEKRKIILYQGGFTQDRRFEEFAQAVKELGDNYCFYMMGVKNDYLEKILKEFPFIVYLGSLNPPEHLLVANYAYIGLLTYIPVQTAFYSELNALYCAPNKIYEYALCNLPMLGTDVPGLRTVFDKYDIGRCCDEINTKSIVKAVKEIEVDYDTIRDNCKTFYNATNLDNIVDNILGGNND